MQNEPKKKPIEVQIEENLKRVYQETEQEPVPDKFLDLIRQLKEQDRSNAK